MDWKGNVPQATQVVDLRQPPDAYRRKNPNFNVAKQSTDLFAAVAQIQDQQAQPDYWEQNEAYTKWMEKRDSYNLAGDIAIIRKAQEGLANDPQDPEIARYELQTISIGERLRSLQQIMRPNNGR
jgi:hypothetical protein